MRSAYHIIISDTVTFFLKNLKKMLMIKNIAEAEIINIIRVNIEVLHMAYVI